ncbi:MAG: GNAT family N-acetyltransferase [Tuberibacillus sp.]
MIKGKKVTLKPLTKSELPLLYELMHETTGDIPEWKKWDAPYYPYFKPSYRSFRHQYQSELAEKNRYLIYSGELLIGMVTFYWEHQPSNWLEAGIVIYRPEYWNGGYGTEAMFLWVDHLFKTLPIVRCGFTTWSGNKRMMKVGEKLGMTLEARLRKCRLYNGVYYDSIRYGILREEWAEHRAQLKEILFINNRPEEHSIL